MLIILYSEVVIFCISILLLLLYKVMTGVGIRNNQRLFIKVLISNIILFIIDLIWIFINGNFLLNVLYYIQSGINGFIWFEFSENVQESGFTKNKKIKWLAMFPLFVLIILIVTSYYTKLMFYIDENNIYHRGKLYPLQLFVVYGYVIFTALKAVIRGIHSKNYDIRSKYLILASFVVLPLVFGMLQVWYPHLPLICVGITFSLLNLYFDFQEQLISIDPLTQLNNRNQLIKFLSAKIAYYSRSSSDKNLYLLMMDVDYFKIINDKYGHIEGDRALVRVADSLKKACGKYNYFVSRYGGDEFIIICEVDDISEVKTLCENIHMTISENNKNEELQYTLSLSIGYIKYERNMDSIQKFISGADAELYKVKQARKKGYQHRLCSLGIK